MTTIYAVAGTNYSPPEVHSVWSKRKYATDRCELLNNNRHGIYKVFTIVVDSGKFDVGNETWNAVGGAK